MQNLYIWPHNPALSMIVLFVLSQILLYAARVPIHRGLRNVGHILGGAFRLAARWSQSTARELRRRNSEVLLEAGRLEMEQKLEKEFQRLATTFSQELKEYPTLHRRLDEGIKKIDADLKESSVSPPEAPGWADAVRAVTSMPKAGDRGVQKVLDEIHRSAVASEKKALAEYRATTGKRHKALAGMAPTWKAVKAVLDQTHKAVTGTLAATTRIDAHMEKYEKIRKAEDAAERLLAGSALNLFLISAFLPPWKIPKSIKIADSFVSR